MQASQGYKYTGTTVALDGSEDHLICREAGGFFRDLRIAEKRARALDDIDSEWDAGRLRWTYDDVYKIVLPFSRTWHLDTTTEFQDDEEVLEPGGLAWREEDEDQDEQDDCSDHGSGLAGSDAEELVQFGDQDETVVHKAT